MALKPQVPGEANADQNVVIEAEIDLAGLPRAGPVPEGSLELHARIAMLADKLERPSQNGICQGHCRRVFRGTINGPAEPGVMQRGFEISVADFEHRQHAEQRHLVEDLAACFGDRQASVQGCTRRIALSAHLHGRNAKARLQIYLRVAAPSVVVESKYSPLRPAMAFAKQGHCQENRCGGRGEADADGKAAFGAEAPFQCRANVVDVGKRRRSLLPVILDSLEQSLIVLGMPSAELLQVVAFCQLREGIDPRRFKQPEIAGDSR